MCVRSAAKARADKLGGRMMGTATDEDRARALMEKARASFEVEAREMFIAAGPGLGRAVGKMASGMLQSAKEADNQAAYAFALCAYLGSAVAAQAAHSEWWKKGDG